MSDVCTRSPDCDISSWSTSWLCAAAGAVTEHGDAMTWGGGRFWQLGHGSASQDEPAPVTVPGLRGVRQVT